MNPLHASAAALAAITALAAPALAQNATLTQDQLLTIASPFGNGVINSVSASGAGVLVQGDLGDESGDFSRIVIAADFFDVPLDFSAADAVTLNVKLEELNVPFASTTMFIQTPDGNGGFTFIEGANTQLPPGQTIEVSVPLDGVLNNDQVARVGFQFFGPGPLFPDETPISILLSPTGSPTCSAADLAAPFGALNFFDVLAYISLFNDGCDQTGSVGANPASLTTMQISEMNAINGTINSAAVNGAAVDFNATVASGSGFTVISLAYGFGTPADLSANDTVEFELTLLAGDGLGARVVTKDGPSFTFIAGEIADLAVGVPTIVSLDLSTVEFPNDIREINIDFFGAAIGDLTSPNFDLRVRPVQTTCGPADLAAPLGQLNFFDLLEYISVFNQGCP